jgi:hypothetical protein
MSKILDQLPISKRDDLVFVGQERVQIRAYEIIVWISLRPKGALAWHLDLPPFPAILDTGHTHNFSIREDHLSRWAGLDTARLRSLGNLRQQGRLIPLHAANVWLHQNVRRNRDQLLDRPPQLLELPRGIAVHPVATGFPRLPLLGLRALIANNLHLTLVGDQALVNLRTPDWRTWLLRRLS